MVSVLLPSSGLDKSVANNVGNLPGSYAVWAASENARFLHGRFTWCTWDIEDIASDKMKAELEKDPWLLKVGIKGL